jgi:integrase
MTAKQMEKQAAFEAEKFEEAVNKGIVALDGKIKFEDYAAIWMANSQLAYKTRERYNELLRRINAAIGHLRLENIQAHHLEAFYKNLAEDGIKDKGRFATMNGLDQIMDERKITRDSLSKLAGIAPSTVGAARSNKRVSIESANKIAAALNVPAKQICTLIEDTSGLSDKTILHHHRLISAILSKAKRERRVPFNVALEHATAPKVTKKEARYLDDEQARELVIKLLNEPDIRIRTSILLALYSGVRRGELCGLSWQDIDERRGVIHVLKASQYQRKNGIVEVSTKNESSKRPIRVQPIVFQVLSQYKAWWLGEKMKNGSRWKGQEERLFIQADGKPINPDTINYWLDKFIIKHGLERFTPHSLRHTFSTLQIMAGVNIRTLQSRTGHAQASTLTNIYAHAIKTADEMASDVLDDVLTPKNLTLMAMS